MYPSTLLIICCLLPSPPSLSSYPLLCILFTVQLMSIPLVLSQMDQKRRDTPQTRRHHSSHCRFRFRLVCRRSSVHHGHQCSSRICEPPPKPTPRTCLCERHECQGAKSHSSSRFRSSPHLSMIPFQPLAHPPPPYSFLPP